MKFKLSVNILICVLLTVFIFGNSADFPSESSALSSFVSELFRPFFDLFVDTHSFNFNHFVRKLAHFVEFAALGIAVSFTAGSVEKLVKKSVKGYSLFYLLAVAVIDEYIQRFFDRGSSVADVMLDFSGAVFGLVSICAVRLVAKCVRKVYFRISNLR